MIHPKFEYKTFSRTEGQLITVIMPFRASPSRPDLVQRITNFKHDNNLPSSICFCLADHGSPENKRDEIETKCKENDINYLYIYAEDQPFSIAIARNIAAMNCHTDYIMFQDVDLVPYNGFYQSVIAEIEIQDLSNFSNDMIMFGVIYLTKLASKKFFTIPKDLRKNYFYHQWLNSNKEMIEKYSTGTSVTLINREYYLSCGGMDEEFLGWGYEDLEFNLRIMRKSKKFQLPREFHIDRGSFANQCRYHGWKSFYRLLGDITFNKGICLFHLWHDVINGNTEKTSIERNRSLFTSKIISFAKDGQDPPPLPSLIEGTTLLLNKNPFTYNKGIIPRLGEIIFRDEFSFGSIEEFLNFIESSNINRVMFHNPYANEARMALYKECRDKNVPYFVAERGSLRDSLFYDPNGFNADSASYNHENWNSEISDVNRQKTMDYITKELSTEESLESQGRRLGRRGLATKLEINPRQKVLFVPLQRPSDTVITHLAGEIGNFSNFIRLIEESAEKLGKNWITVVKKHPLETEQPDIKNVIYAEEETNIKDLLELCDAVLLINSGVGVLSMFYNKPVFYAGRVFYGHDQINRHVTSAEDVGKIINEGFQPDKETSIRFISYLVNDFYSFGKFTTRRVDWHDGGNMTATTNIDLYQIRGIGKSPANYYIDNTIRTTNESPLFDRYRFDLGQTGPAPTGKRNQMCTEKTHQPETVMDLAKNRIRGIIGSTAYLTIRNTLKNVLR